MVEIGKKIARQEYDVYLLEELWMKPDHATVKSFLPEGKPDNFFIFCSRMCFEAGACSKGRLRHGDIYC